MGASTIGGLSAHCDCDVIVAYVRRLIALGKQFNLNIKALNNACIIVYFVGVCLDITRVSLHVAYSLSKASAWLYWFCLQERGRLVCKQWQNGVVLAGSDVALGAYLRIRK
jgi:hypothetical protein